MVSLVVHYSEIDGDVGLDGAVIMLASFAVQELCRRLLGNRWDLSMALVPTPSFTTRVELLWTHREMYMFLITTITKLER